MSAMGRPTRLRFPLLDTIFRYSSYHIRYYEGINAFLHMGILQVKVLMSKEIAQRS